MAQQTILIGSAANDGTGDGIRTGGDKINDNFTELYGAVTALQLVVPAAVMRTGNEAAAGGAETILFSSSFVNDYSILCWHDSEGMLTVSSKTANGFDIEPLGAGNITYIAIILI